MRPGSVEVLVIGAGPAGLTAALEAVRQGRDTLVVERTAHLGGIARTEVRDGYRFDVGGHRFFTRLPEVEHLWRELLGPDLIEVRRLSRIRFRGRFLSYPLRPLEALGAMGMLGSIHAAASYAAGRLLAPGEPRDLEAWLVRSFGRELYRTFFADYTAKVWGRPASSIHAGWAAQRIRGVSLRSAVAHALLGRSTERSLIGSFLYPRLGPGMMWERCADEIVAGGGRIETGAEVTRLELDRSGAGVIARVRTASCEREVTARHVLSSMPLPALVRALEPAAPEPVREAARRLAHRSLVVVCLVLEGPPPFPDQWIYLQEPEVRAGRLQCFGNWSPGMLAEPGTTSLGFEYFCDAGDALWRLPDSDLVERALADLELLGLKAGSRVLLSHVIRQPAAYPVYDLDYERHRRTLIAHLATVPRIQTIGRNGLHRYNNQDHSMLTGLLAARNLAGERHDLWSVNDEGTYLEAADRARATTAR